ncbi:hypothetical protein [Bacillus sp. JCM 19034]|uniref:hypothetical protein n=1 Tax=Bacillus sp. JCM 19034 TaxID=1481928 RepID=UPI000783C8C1|nr:hypothetical protein [Bacillus sp. JCM 19034]
MIQTHYSAQINNTMQQQIRTAAFATGQIFQGKVLKLFPNNLASLQINGMNMTGMLEASLVAGERYWFQVIEAKGVPRLKVLELKRQETASKQTSKTPVVDLLKYIGVPFSKAAESVVVAFQKQGLSFSKEMILDSVQLLQHTSLRQEQALQLIVQLIQRQLPLTPAIFDAFQTYEHSENLSTQLQSLLQLLNQSSDRRANEWVPKLQPVMQKFTVTMSQTTLIQQLISFMLSNNETDSETARTILQRLGMNFNQTELLNEVRPLLVPNDKGGTPFGRVELMTFISQVKEQDFQLIIRHLFNQSPSDVQSRLHALIEQPLSQAERQLLIQIFRTERAQMQLPPLQMLSSLLGFDFEQMISRVDLANDQSSITQQNMKSLLLTMQQQPLQRDIQMAVSNLVQTITAQQLLSQEQIGALQQYLFSIPLQLGDFHTNMTMQWEGQKNNDGQLNPEYCRILFYLTLEHLRETVVDVMIQNRIVSITIHNEQDQPSSLMNLLTPALKSALDKKDYHLLTISWKQLKEVNVKTTDSSHTNSTYQGVDIRI